MITKTFNSATRQQENLLAPYEKKTLIWLARQMPRWINSDHLTLLGFLGMALAGGCYLYARWKPIGLFGAVAFLALNWFGDSLDGTLARVRNRQRPRYGFYVDHIVDAFGAIFLIGGMGLSGYMTGTIALILIVAYFLLAIEIYLATYTVGVFRLSFGIWGTDRTAHRAGIRNGGAVQNTGSQHRLRKIPAVRCRRRGCDCGARELHDSLRGPKHSAAIQRRAARMSMGLETIQILLLRGLLQRREFFGKQRIRVRYRTDALECRSDNAGLAGNIKLKIRFLEQSVLRHQW